MLFNNATQSLKTVNLYSEKSLFTHLLLLGKI